MRRRKFVALFGGVVAAWPFARRAQHVRDRRLARHARGIKRATSTVPVVMAAVSAFPCRQRHRAGPGAARRHHHWAVILARCSTGTIVFCGRWHLRAAEEESKCLTTI